jgi:hypothetical protein
MPQLRPNPVAMKTTKKVTTSAVKKRSGNVPFSAQ